MLRIFSVSGCGGCSKTRPHPTWIWFAYSSRNVSEAVLAYGNWPCHLIGSEHPGVDAAQGWAELFVTLLSGLHLAGSVQARTPSSCANCLPNLKSIHDCEFAVMAWAILFSRAWSGAP